MSLNTITSLGEQSGDTYNTTTTPLGAAATFTGSWEQNGWPSVIVSCQCDSTATLHFDFSVDGTNYSSFPSSGFDVTSGVHEFHMAIKGPRWFRVRLVNGSSAQSYLRLFTYYTLFGIPNAPLNQTLGSDADAITVRSYPIEVDLALGKLGGVQTYTKFGHVTGLDAADNAVDVWAFGNDAGSPRRDTKNWPSAASTFYLASTSGSDSDVDVTVEYIDANGAAASVTVNTNGQTAVSLGVSCKDVNRAYCSGTNANVGNITILTANNFTAGAATDTAEVVAMIPAGLGQTQNTHFTVPSGKQLIVKQINLLVSRASGAAGSADIYLKTQDSGKAVRVRRIYYMSTEASVNEVDGTVVLAAGARLWLTVNDVSDTDTNVVASIRFDLVDA